MISIFPAEPSGPAQSLNSRAPSSAANANDAPERSSFSSYVDRVEPSDTPQSDGADRSEREASSSPQLESGLAEKDVAPERVASPPHDQDANPVNAAELVVTDEAADISTVKVPNDAPELALATEPDSQATPQADVEVKPPAETETSVATAVSADRDAVIKTGETLLTAPDGDAAEVKTDTKLTAAPTADDKALTVAPTADDTALTRREAVPGDADIGVAQKRAATDQAAPIKTSPDLQKVADTMDPAARALTPRGGETLNARADDTLQIQRMQDGSERIETDFKLTQAGTGADVATATAIDKVLTQTVVGRDAPTPILEPLMTLGQAAPSNPAQQLVAAGLTPTAPAVQIAAPTDITGIIMNAMKNGVEPQDQLIVQLDPPELGRVLIDFKFDAHGMQQITVSAENPEALKRLRELHFELTEALKDHGLSDKNLSFRQHADDQRSPNWQNPNYLSTGPALDTVETTPALAAIPAVSERAMVTDRLDLTL